MKATTLNTIFWTTAVVALSIHSVMQGWDAVSAIASSFGYSLLCFAAWLSIDSILKKGE